MNGLHVVIQIDLEYGHGDALAARAAEGGVDIAEGIHGRVGHRVQTVGDGEADIAGPRFARLVAAGYHQFSGGGAFRHAGDNQRIRADHHWRGYVADGHARPVGFRKAFSLNDQLAAHDGGCRLHLGDLRTAVGRFRIGILLIKIEASR